MIQAYSSNLTIGANTFYPLNNVIVDKGTCETFSGPSTIQLNKRGVYLVEVDGFITGSAAGTGSTQLYVNNVAQPQAVCEFASAAGDVSNFSLKSLVQVTENNCPCNCTTSPTTLQFMNSLAGTDAHINVVVTKIC